MHARPVGTVLRLAAPTMNVRGLTWVWPHAEASAGPLLVLLVLAGHAHDDGGGSGRHSAVWRRASRPRRTTVPFIAAWNAVPHVDAMIFATRRRLRRP